MNRKAFLQTVGATALATSLTGLSSGAMAEHIAGVKPADKGVLKRGVSLYSYQEEFYTHAMTLEDCLSEASSIGAREIEYVAEEMTPDFPNPSDKWVGQWHEWMAKYNLNADTYTQFQDTYLTKTHDLTVDEGLVMLERDLKLAKRMGFDKMRLLIGTPLEIIDKGIPLAEKFDIWMGCEAHPPLNLDGTLIPRWIEIAEKHNTKHFGVVPDFGIFVARPVNVWRERMVRDGVLTESVSQYIVNAWEDGTPKDRVLARVTKMIKSPGDLDYVTSVYSTRMEDPKLLRKWAPYIRHFHAKFYEMSEQLVETSIPYDQILPIIINAGINATIVSEYEGQRSIQDVKEPQACEQVRRQHAMLKRILGA